MIRLGRARWAKGRALHLRRRAGGHLDAVADPPRPARAARVERAAPGQASGADHIIDEVVLRAEASRVHDAVVVQSGARRWILWGGS